MQQTQIHNFHNPRLSTSSHSSLSAATTALLNGLLPSHRFSQTSANAHTLASNLTPHQLKELQKTNNKLKRIKKIKHASIITILTIVLALLLIITIELSKKLVTIQSNINRENITLINNRTYQKQYPIRAFFTCVWIFNGLLFLNCFIIHSIIIQQRSRRGRTTIAFLRYIKCILFSEHPLSLRQEEKLSILSSFFYNVCENTDFLYRSKHTFL